MVPAPDDLEQALHEARNGDGDALALLWRAHQPVLLRYVRGRGVEDAEDVTTQVWIDAARGLGRFEGEAGDFRRWLFTVAHRRIVDWRRRRARQTTAASSWDETSPGADVEFEERDALDRALALVAQLPDPMREAVLLRVVADLSVADTARVMGVRAGNVRVLVHRGLRRLERLLTARGESAVTLTARQTMYGSR